MVRRSDIAVYAPDGTLQLVVEVKNRPGASSDWAARMLRNMVAHTAIPNAPYFMLALPDAFYLWEIRGPLSQDPRIIESGFKPDHKIDATRALGSYLDGSPSQLTDISEQGLELLVASWLTDLLNSDLAREKVDPDLYWFFDSGLYEAIHRGFLATEAVL